MQVQCIEFPVSPHTITNYSQFFIVFNFSIFDGFLTKKTTFFAFRVAEMGGSFEVAEHYF